MTTIYKQPKSVHTSGNGGITVRATENVARVHPMCAPLSTNSVFSYSSYLFPELPAIANELFAELHHSRATLREGWGEWLRAEG